MAVYDVTATLVVYVERGARRNQITTHFGDDKLYGLDRCLDFSRQEVVVGNEPIGRRYRRQDEAGTPFCVTYDFDSEEDGRVTVRERDSMAQKRVALDAVAGYLGERVECGA